MRSERQKAMPYNSGPTTTDISNLVAGYLIFGLIIMVVSVIFTAIVYWKIFAKAGYSGALGLLMFIPIANIVMLCVLAFAEWPIRQELNQLRQQVNRYPQYPGPYYAQQQQPMPQPPLMPQPQPPQYPQYPPRATP
jgi:NADH:ubiquinone oxidoreductase subunit 3 (subunit A)